MKDATSCCCFVYTAKQARLKTQLKKKALPYSFPKKD
jgi:hypothetical protein